jgi:hypothetical protein
MEKLSVFVGTTNHVPYGSEDAEFEMVYRNRLKPFIVALNNFPKIKAALHYSGVLLHWIEKAHPEFFMLVGDLISRRQVELLGGGFYEPMFPLIPPQDRIGQIEMLTTYIRKQFGKRPLGCWLPAAAWDQSLVGALTASGLGYTFLREQQFLQAGLSGEDLYAPCLTEDQGKLLMVFPVLNRLTREEASLSGLLEKKAAEIPPGGERLIVLCPDCFFEGLGVEPLSEAERNINRFFEELSACETFVEFSTPGKIYKTRRSRKKAYFSVSAELETEAQPKNVLIRYPEANGIYAKMTYTHLLINQLRGDKSRKQSSQEELWKGQGYDSFCRSAGGGVFRNGVRNAAYRALLEAEKITRKKGVFIPSLMTVDFDLDGEDEYLFQGEHINCYVKTRGASVFEFDFLPRSWNYLDTFGAAAYTEPWKRRSSFTDILASPAVPLDDLTGTEFQPEREDSHEEGSSHERSIRYLGAELWEAGEIDKTKKKAEFFLNPPPDGAFSAIAVRKIYYLKKDSLQVTYALSNKGQNPETFNFIPRIDLAFSGEGEHSQRIYKLKALSSKEAESGGQDKFSREPLSADPPPEGIPASTLEFQDLKNEVIITLSSNETFNAFVHPIRSAFPVYGEDKLLYQSTCILPVNFITLSPGSSWTAEFTLKLSY